MSKTLHFGFAEVNVVGGGNQLVLIHCDAPEAEKIYALTGADFTLASVSGIDWNRDLTPWEARGVFRGEGDFSGGANAYLSRLTCEILPALGDFDRRFIAGYSLAGLFSIYAVTRVNCFSGAASVSGSLWYDGFADYVCRGKIIGSQTGTATEIFSDSVYFSLGDAESRSRNQRLASVGSRTSEIFSEIKRRGLGTTFVLNSGGHFIEPEKRTADAINWLLHQH